MVPDFSGRLILSNELGVIGRASTDNLGVGTFGPTRPMWLMWPQVAKSGSKIWTEWDRAYIFSSLDSSWWADHFSVVEHQNWIKNGQDIATQRLAKIGRAANFEPISGYLSHVFFEIRPPDLFCPSILWRLIGIPILKQIGLELAILIHKNHLSGH